MYKNIKNIITNRIFYSDYKKNWLIWLNFSIFLFILIVEVYFQNYYGYGHYLSILEGVFLGITLSMLETKSQLSNKVSIGLCDDKGVRRHFKYEPKNKFKHHLKKRKSKSKIES